MPSFWGENIGNLVSADAKAGGCALTTPYLNNSFSHFKMGLKKQSKKDFSNVNCGRGVLSIY